MNRIGWIFLVVFQLWPSSFAFCHGNHAISPDSYKPSHKKAAETFLEINGTRRDVEKSMKDLLELQIKGKPDLAPFREIMLEFFKGM